MKKNKNFKFGLSTYLWLGFNYSCNISFVLIFGTLFTNSQNQGFRLGYNVIWIFVIDAFLALSISLAYIALVKNHHKVNGGAYVFVRASSGRFWGFFVSASQYLVLPASILTNIVALVRRNFLADPGANSPTSINAWGSWHYASSLYLDIIGIGAFVLISLLVIFGLRWLKLFLFATLYLRWIAVGIIIIFSIALIAIHDAAGFSVVANNTNFQYTGFTRALTQSFFFFLGFESFAAISSHLKNPARTVPRGITAIIGLLTLFYISIIVLMIGALVTSDHSGFTSNPYLSIFDHSNFSYTIETLGVAVVLITILTTKINFVSQLTFYSTHGGMQPMAKENYVPKLLADKNRYGVYGKAIWLNVFITLFLGFFFLIIPDIFVWKDHILPSNNPLNFGTLLSLATILLLLTYIYVLVLAVWLRTGHKKKVSWFLISYWFWGLAVAGFIIVNFFILLINDLANSINKGTVGPITINFIELGYFVAVFIFNVVWYYAYYQPIYKNRMQNNPLIQAKLDSEYYVLPYNSNLERAIAVTDIPWRIPNRTALIQQKVADYDLTYDKGGQK